MAAERFYLKVVVDPRSGGPDRHTLARQCADVLSCLVGVDHAMIVDPPDVDNATATGARQIAELQRRLEDSERARQKQELRHAAKLLELIVHALEAELKGGAR